MHKIWKYFLTILLLQLGLLFTGFGQEPVTVRDIVIYGNAKTRSSIILREISFRPGESFFPAELEQRSRDAEIQLMNTSLFHSAKLEIQYLDSMDANVIVYLKERWYIFPMLVFKPVDRNWNQWLVEKKADMGRVNYGVKLMYNNVSGVNDRFRASFITGYTRQISLSYNRLYIDRKLRWGVSGGFSIGKTRELNYNTSNDKQVFLSGDHFVRNFSSANLALSYRKAIHTRHSVGISFSSERVADTIVALNPDYFKDGRKNIAFPTIYYTVDYLNLDYNAYPTKGYAASVGFSKSGINKTVNVWQLHLKTAGFLPLSNSAFIQASAYGGIKLPFKQPWFAQRFLGYGDVYLQGYEYFVIDGAAGGYFKTSVAQKLLDLSIGAPHFKKRFTGDRIPFKVYGKVFGNAGYVYNPEPGNNTLSNRILVSGGIGLDIVTFYDIVLKLEWSFNQLGQNGLFLHPKSIY